MVVSVRDMFASKCEQGSDMGVCKCGWVKECGREKERESGMKNRLVETLLVRDEDFKVNEKSFQIRET